MAKKSKTLYLWDMASTIFYEEWNVEKTGCNTYEEWVEKQLNKKIEEVSDREVEEMFKIPYSDGWYFKLDLQKGVSEVLPWTKNNEAFTTGNPEQFLWRTQHTTPKTNFNARDYFQKINSTFDFGETNDKTEEMFLSILDNKYKEGFRTVVYTDDKVENAKFFKQVAEKIKEKYNDFDYRVYHILNDDKGLRNKDWYCEIGSLYDLLENEKSINK